MSRPLEASDLALFHQACSEGNDEAVQDILSVNSGVMEESYNGRFAIHSVLLCPDHDKRFDMIAVLGSYGCVMCCYGDFLSAEQKDAYESWYDNNLVKPLRISQRSKRTGISPLDMILHRNPSTEWVTLISEIFTFSTINERILMIEDARDLALAEHNEEMQDFLNALLKQTTQITGKEVKKFNSLDVERRRLLLDMKMDEMEISRGYVFSPHSEMIETITTFLDFKSETDLNEVEIMVMPAAKVRRGAIAGEMTEAIAAFGKAQRTPGTMPATLREKEVRFSDPAHADKTFSLKFAAFEAGTPANRNPFGSEKKGGR